MIRALSVVLALAACGAKQTPPSAPVRAEIDRAEAAEKKRQHEVARAHYQAAIARAHDPASVAFARREFAETLISWGEYPEATVQLEGVVVAAPGDTRSWHDLGHLYDNRGDAQRAIAAFEKARDLAPGVWVPRRSLAALRWKRGDLPGALAEYRAMLEIELPHWLRPKVEWAVGELTRRLAQR